VGNLRAGCCGPGFPDTTRVDCSHPTPWCRVPMTNPSRKRRVLCLFLLPAAMILAIALGVCLIPGAVLNAPWFLPFAETALQRLTGLTVETDAIRFRYPFHLGLEGLAVEGTVGGVDVRIRAGGVEIRSGAGGLLRGSVNSIRVWDVQAAVRFGREGKPSSASAETILEFPGWVRRIRNAQIQNASLEVQSGHAPLGVAGIDLTWRGDPERSSGELTVSLRDPRIREDDLSVRVEEDRFLPGAGPVLLPDLDLASLAAFAGKDLPVSGTLSGSIQPLPHGGGVEGVCLDLRAEDLSVQGDGLAAVFAGGEVALHVRALFPLSMGERLPSLEAFRLNGEASGFVREVLIRDVAIPRDLDPLAFRVSFEMDGGADTTAWDAEGSDGKGVFTVRTTGTGAGLLRGTAPRLAASVSAACTDLPLAVSLLAPDAGLPAGMSWGGGVEGVGHVSGTPQSVMIQGAVKSKSLFLRNAKSRAVPVRWNLALKGWADESGIREMELSTKGFRVGELATLDARADYRPEGVRWRVKTGSVQVQKVAEFLAPALPEPLQGFEWGAHVAVSSDGEFLPGAGGGLKAGFRLQCSQGRFASGDFQRMGEGLALDVSGTVSLGERGSAAVWNAKALVSGGEIVHDGLYVNLAPIRPAFHLEMETAFPPGRVNLTRSGLDLAGLGTFRLSGTRDRQGPDTELRADVEARDVDLEGVSRVLQEGGFAERWPFLHTVQGAGLLGLRVQLYQGSGASAARGRLVLAEGAVSRAASGVSVTGIRADLPFSVGPASALDRLPGGVGAAAEAGLVSCKRVDFRGIVVPGVEARLRIHRDRVDLVRPLEAELSGGRLTIPQFVLSGLTSGEREGRVSLQLEGADLAPLTGGLLGAKVEGRVSAWIPNAGLRDGRFFSESGRIQAQSGGGRLQVEDLALGFSPPADLNGRFNLWADAFPLEALSAGVLQDPPAGTLDGRLAPVEISGGRLRTTGELRVSLWGGRVRISGVRGSNVAGPEPSLEADLEIRGLHLAEMTSPVSFGTISGVMQGEVLGLRIGGRFPYLEAFRLNLETVKVRGVPRKIGARAVENLSRIGGSSVLGAALSSGFLSLFDEYYYRKIGVSAVLAQGWLELHGIPGKGGREYLITRSWRLPTISMPLKVQGDDRKVRFGSWISYVQGFGGID